MHPVAATYNVPLVKIWSRLDLTSSFKKKGDSKNTDESLFNTKNNGVVGASLSSKRKIMGLYINIACN